MKRIWKSFDSALIAWLGGVIFGLGLAVIEDPDSQKHFIAQTALIMGLTIYILSAVARHKN
jgi:hypothetical protein